MIFIDIFSIASFFKLEKEINLLDKECFPDRSWDSDQWVKLFQNYRLRILIAQKDENIAGFIAFSDIDGESEIFKVGVKKTDRNLSIGQQLIENVTNYLKQQKTNRVFLEVRSDNQSGIKLYTKCQFKLISRRKNYYQNPNRDALIFQLKIKT